MTDPQRTATLPEHPTRAWPRLVAGGSRAAMKPRVREAVPESAIVPVGRDAPAGRAGARSDEADAGSSSERALERNLEAALSDRIERGSKRSRGLPRRHRLMLALAVEVLWLGIAYAQQYRPPGIAVDAPQRPGHVIT